MGGNSEFGNAMVKHLLLAGFSLLSTCPLSSTFAEEGEVLYCNFTYPVSSTDSTTIEVGFSLEPITVAVGKSHTVWIQLTNKGRTPVNAVVLPIDIHMERKGAKGNVWELLREGTPLVEGEGNYYPSGVKGFYPMPQIDEMTVTVLEEGQKWYSSSCVPPGYMLRSGMSVVLQQNLTFLKEGLWRLSYNINGREYHQYIVSRKSPIGISFGLNKNNPFVTIREKRRS